MSREDIRKVNGVGWVSIGPSPPVHPARKFMCCIWNSKNGEGIVSSGFANDPDEAFRIAVDKLAENKLKEESRLQDEKLAKQTLDEIEIEIERKANR